MPTWSSLTRHLRRAGRPSAERASRLTQERRVFAQFLSNGGFPKAVEAVAVGVGHEVEKRFREWRFKGPFRDCARVPSPLAALLKPDLFREGQGIVATGVLTAENHIEAHEVLAKHDEEYMPPELAEKMKGIKHVKPEQAYSTPKVSG